MITVHGAALSPFVRKVLLTLEYKGVPFENLPIFPGSDDPEFRKLSPLGKIPALDHDGFGIPDSSIICRYLDSTFPEKSIYPVDAKEQALASWIEEFCDSKLMDAIGTIFQNRFLKPNMMGQPCDEDAVQEAINNGLPPLLDYLESIMPDQGYLVGDSLSIADLSVATCFAQAQYGGYEVDGSNYPKTRRYLDSAFGTTLLSARLEVERAMFAPDA